MVHMLKKKEHKKRDLENGKKKSGGTQRSRTTPEAPSLILLNDLDGGGPIIRSDQKLSIGNKNRAHVLGPD